MSKISAESLFKGIEDVKVKCGALVEGKSYCKVIYFMLNSNMNDL
jgi:hypothetical protein